MTDDERAEIDALATRVGELEKLLGPTIEEARRRAEDERQREVRRREIEADLDELGRRRAAAVAMLPAIESRARTMLANGVDNFEAVVGLHDTQAEVASLDMRIKDLTEELRR